MNGAQAGPRQVGDLTGDKDLKKEGKADEAAGKFKEIVKDVVNVVSPLPPAAEAAADPPSAPPADAD